MISTSYDKAMSKEDFLLFLEYSVPLVIRKEEEESELEELAEKSILNEKDPKNLVYIDNYQQERLSGVYSSVIGTYLAKRQEALQDFSDRVPGKHMHILPESIMGGILGFTYLGENFMARRADLTGNMAKTVDIHECIHTPNEYETRLLTAWIMTKEMPRYIK